jgi:hypothetical protein
MNILLYDGLPEDYKGIPLSTDFRNMINVDLLLQEEEGDESKRFYLALHQLYEDIPKDTNKALEGLMWFYSRGKSVTGDSSDESPEKGFSFSQDANLIYSAFFNTYGLSLSTVEYLHWWEFMALFEGLPEDTMIKRVMYWRTVDLDDPDMSKTERKHIQKMRKLFALKVTGKQSKPLTAEELNQKTKDKVARRFAEAEAALEKSLQE